MKRQQDHDDCFTKSYRYRLYPNKQDADRFDQYCDYRRYVWNKIKADNDHAYQAYRYERLYYAKTGVQLKSKEFCNKYPNFYSLKKSYNADKKLWEYKYPSKIALMTMTDYDNALTNFVKKVTPDWGSPTFRSKHNPKQGFKLNSKSVKLSGHKIILAKGRKDKRSNLSLYSKQEFLDYDYGTVSFIKEKNRYYVVIPYYIPKKDIATKTAATKTVGIDLNVSHYNFYDGKQKTVKLNLKQLQSHYLRVKHYQRLLAKKREVSSANKYSHNYIRVRTKLQLEYDKVSNLQADFLNKLINKLCHNYRTIVIEDLDVRHMKMGIASKGLHRAMFGKFRQKLINKVDQYGINLIIADRFYPSTQRCSNCSYIKTGDEKITLWGNRKHHTRHDQYICYHCGAHFDRDENAATNLYQYPDLN